MQTLAEEWKKRDKEREMIFQRKVDEYSKLEEKLRTVSVHLKAFPESFSLSPSDQSDSPSISIRDSNIPLHSLNIP